MIETIKHLNEALWVAALKGDTEIAVQLIEQGAYVSAAINDSSPLHIAAFHGHAEMCSLLLRAGALVTKRVGHGNTALHMACDPYQGRISRETIQCLLDAGMDPNWPRHFDMQSPLHLLAYSEDEGVIPAARLLGSYGARSNLGLAEQRLAVVNDLGGLELRTLGKGAKRAACEAYLTPFQLAIYFGNRDLIDYYIDSCGESIHERTVAGQSMFDVLIDRSEEYAVLLSVQTERALQLDLSGNSHGEPAAASHTSNQPSMGVL